MVGIALLAAALVSGITLGRTGRAAAGLWKRPVVDRLKEMSWHEVERLLDRVAKEPEPASTMGAMCYAAVALPEVAEYVCPVCGEKTLYSSSEARTVSSEIPAAPSQFAMLQQVSDLEMRLDETGFCSYCSPDTTDLRLVLEITYSDGRRVSSVVTAQDLSYLVGLFGDGLSYSTWNDGREPLKPHLERLREILGFTREQR